MPFNPARDSDNIPEPIRRRRWLGLPIVQPAGATFREIRGQLPQFGRQPFSMSSVNGKEVAVNAYLDMIYRLPTRQNEDSVPVGIVSKNYRLVDHQHVLRIVEDVLVSLDIESSNIGVQAQWTVHGERARFSLVLPSERRFTVKLDVPGDEMKFRLEIFNSVDGSCRLMVVAGWLRLVCSNGLILSTSLTLIRQQHRQQLQIEEMGSLLREALQSAENDMNTIANWRSRPVRSDVFTEWVDNNVMGKWGFKAAVRVFAIAKTGRDAHPKGDIRDKRPSEVAREQTIEVPGVVAPVDHMFGVSQALTWVAGQRSDLQEDLEWRSQVPELMALLIEKSRDDHFLFDEPS